MLRRIVLFGSFVLVVLAIRLGSEIACPSNSSSSNIESKNIDSVQELFSAIDQLEKSRPFNISALEKIFGCKYTVDGGFCPYGSRAISRGLNSTLIKQVKACLPYNGPNGDTGGKIFISLKPNISVTIDQVKRHFGADVHLFKDIAAEDQPIEYSYHRKLGWLTFCCPYGDKTVQRIWFVE